VSPIEPDSRRKSPRFPVRVQAHVDLSLGRIAPVGQIETGDFVQVMDGEEVRRLRVGSAEYEAWLKGLAAR
jgi:hypothetical protein